MSSARSHLLWSLLAGLLAFGASLRFDASPDLSGVMAEVDGVHPVRAAQAFREAYAPGGGFPDKYPPLGSFLMGAVVTLLDGDYAADSAAIPGLPPEGRRVVLWELRERTQRLLVAQRHVSRLALAAAAALLCALALALVAPRGGRARTPAESLLAGLAALFGTLVFACSAPSLYHAGTTNVDALLLLAGVSTLLLCVKGRWVAAAVALALATAVKDPAAALAPVVLVGAWFGGVPLRSGEPAAAAAAPCRRTRARRLGLVIAVGLGTYALASGAVTGPGMWWQHLRYLFAGGILGVDRIDHAAPGQWVQLLGYCLSLVRGALGLGAALMGLAGLGILLRQRPAAGRLLIGALLATPLLFVLPIGFTYARFLLLPTAVLGAGLVVLLVSVAEGPRGQLTWRGLFGAVACCVLVLAGDRQVFDYHELVARAPDARVTMAAELPELVPAGSRLVFFADEREHGPPLDPGRWQLEVAGLDVAEGRLRAWAAGPHDERPAFVLWMSFPTDLPSGRITPREPLPVPGTRVGGVFEVRRVHAARGAESWPVRSMAVRPQLMLLARLPP